MAFWQKETEKNLEVQEIPSEMEVPEHIEKKEGIVPSRTHFGPAVFDNVTKTPLAQASGSGAKITTQKIPAASRASLMTMAKTGKSDDSLTWWALYWLRAIKRALSLGYTLVFGEK
jgi:hypothetical protein